METDYSEMDREGHVVHHYERIYEIPSKSCGRSLRNELRRQDTFGEGFIIPRVVIIILQEMSFGEQNSVIARYHERRGLRSESAEVRKSGG